MTEERAKGSEAQKEGSSNINSDFLSHAMLQHPSSSLPLMIAIELLNLRFKASLLPSSCSCSDPHCRCL